MWCCFPGHAVHPCKLLRAIPGPHPAGALRATGFAPGESVGGRLLRYAILLRLQDQDVPSLARPFARQTVHWTVCSFWLTPAADGPGKQHHILFNKVSQYFRHLFI